MKKLNQNQIDIILILFIAILAFLTSKLEISSLFLVVVLLATSFYFFPIKFFLANGKSSSLISDILISSSLAISIVGYYTDFKVILSVLGILNFGFILYYSFFTLKQKKEENTSKLTILAHYLVMFIIIIFM